MNDATKLIGLEALIGNISYRGVFFEENLFLELEIIFLVKMTFIKKIFIFIKLFNI